ncbi:MAG: DUF4231 domain-containing protein [Oscillospiraceae bacterium]|nr:DUF4231 domain-containing protein [Oscillospiraceae bacterium]
MIKKKWKSNEGYKGYCQKKWDETLEKANITADKEYIENIYQNINDLSEYSDYNKFWWRISECMLIIFTAVISLLNVIAAAVPSDIALWINIAAAVCAAFVSIFNGIKILAAYKETWLRYSKCRSELTMECHKFAANTDDYLSIDKSGDFEDDGARAKAKIAKFKENTTKIIQKDYDRFFANMSKN